jgi:glucose/arabinose dehydrogenase
MRRRIAFGATMAGVLVAGILGGASAGRNTAGAGAAESRAGRATTPSAIGATPVVTGLNYPAAFTFDSGGRIFYGERLTGEIHIYDPSTGTDTLFFTVTNLSITGEQGLLGLALSPSYPTKPFVYAYATRTKPSLQNQILAIKDVGGTGRKPRIVWAADTVAGQYHDGGRIEFGPDGDLYAIVGEGHDSSNAQNLDNDAGKILRMTATGGVPPDNPIPGSLIWVYGVRNSYGFNFDPLTDNLWQTENGPECNDELNFISKGANDGWGPHETCSTPPPPPQNTNQDGPSPVLPQKWFTPTIAPVGMAFCVGCGIGSAEGSFLFGGYNDRTIRQATLSADRLTITTTTVVYTHSNAPLSMERGPDAAIYFSDPSGIWKLIQT